jgi:hypothetical protein
LKLILFVGFRTELLPKGTMQTVGNRNRNGTTTGAKDRGPCARVELMLSARFGIENKIKSNWIIPAAGIGHTQIRISNIPGFGWKQFSYFFSNRNF